MVALSVVITLLLMFRSHPYGQSKSDDTSYFLANLHRIGGLARTQSESEQNVINGSKGFLPKELTAGSGGKHGNSNIGRYVKNRSRHSVLKDHLELEIEQSAILRNTNVSTCSKQRNVVFLKTHKTGSDTTTKIFLQYGDLNNLSFVLPSGDWNLGWPSFIRSKDYLPSNKTFNILCLHTVYNKTQMHNLMPKDTKYVTILREPWKQFKSSFNYFYYELFLNDSNDKVPPVETFLKKTGGYYRGDYKFKYPFVRNFMSFDLGFPPSQYDNVSAIIEFINTIQQDFDLVMILEYFDESLVLLKRTFCWDMIDILYVTANIGIYRYPINDDARPLYGLFGQADIALYDHFKKELQKRIAQERDLKDELAHFKKINLRFRLYCKKIKKYSNLILMIRESRWNEKYRIDATYCHRSHLNILEYIKYMIKKQYDGTLH
ncbi:galactosylceramide sulfotransferase-like [Glandiceps talaboti]